jgi:cation diffusion facilitator CzcD-associated flavoprotein CzcO
VAESDLNPAKGGHSRWIINDRDGPFDAVIVTIGTCGKPKKINFPGMPDATRRRSEDEGGKHSGEHVFKGKVLHSSELDQLQPNDLDGQTVAVIGSGASGVEAVETALAKGAKNTFMFARDDKVKRRLRWFYMS